MPVYEYGCRACGHKTDILHGIHESGPHFCPECGAEGTMRKGIAAPAIVFKGSGWAKKDRGSASRTKAAAREESGSSGSKSEGAESKSGASDSGASESKSGSVSGASESKADKSDSGAAGSSGSSSRPARD